LVPNHIEKFKIMKKYFENSANSRRANCPKTKSWLLGHALWLAVLLAYLGLATVQAASKIAAWGDNSYGATTV